MDPIIDNGQSSKKVPRQPKWQRQERAMPVVALPRKSREGSGRWLEFDYPSHLPRGDTGDLRHWRTAPDPSDARSPDRVSDRSQDTGPLLVRTPTQHVRREPRVAASGRKVGPMSGIGGVWRRLGTRRRARSGLARQRRRPAARDPGRLALRAGYPRANGAATFHIRSRPVRRCGRRRARGATGGSDR